ncbi:MAG: SRPBCC family protein [Rubrivivax sp.]|nr:SRPBCC family protein [Rubrivivax sp.]
MKVQLDKIFDLPGSEAAAWAVLSDIERVASCMPGARITERVDDTHYKGTVAVKFGPANMSFRGEVEVRSLDAASKSLRLVGKGTDSTSGSGASMDLDARIEPVDAASSRLVGRSEVSMSGKAAAFGARLAQGVADQVLKQFVGNFAAQVQAAQAAQEVQPAPAMQGAQAAGTPAPAPAAAPLNAFALAWAVFRDWLRSVFSPRKA